MLDGDGDLARAYRRVDWAATPLGSPECWSDTLRSAVDLMLHTQFPVTLFWGAEFTLLYNEGYVPLIAEKHPDALGRPAAEVFPEAWDFIGPLMVRTLEGEALSMVDQVVPLRRRGFLEDCYFTFSYSAIGNGTEVEGGIDIVMETTDQVISRRRLALLSELTEALAAVEEVTAVHDRALKLLRGSADFVAVEITPGGAGGSVGADADACGGQVVGIPLAPGRDASALVVTLNPRIAADNAYLGFVRLVATTLRQALDRVETRAVERRAAEAQRSLAEAFQRSLLPPPMTSRRPEVAVRYQPATDLAQVGGDWYDWFELPDGALTVVIGDVAGHDQQAAAAMAQVRNMSRGVAYTRHPDLPSNVLQGVDRAMTGTSPDIVATAVLAQVTGDETGPLTMVWSSAGHPPLVLVTPEGTARLLETEPDLLLGLDGDLPRTDASVLLEPGTTVVMFTDGLVERRDAPLVDGLAWLTDALQGTQDLPVELICDRLLNAVGGVEDDVALLVLRA
jgi:hypothetical protein